MLWLIKIQLAADWRHLKITCSLYIIKQKEQGRRATTPERIARKGLTTLPTGALPSRRRKIRTDTMRSRLAARGM